MSKLTEKQRTFCQLYVENGGNSQQAAIGAGYSPNYVKSKAHLIINHPLVAQEINRLRQRMNQMADKSATDVVNEYARIAFADRTGFLKPDPDFEGCFVYKSPDELTEEQRAVIEKVHTQWRKVERKINGEKIEVERQEFNYTLSDKANALQQMGRHFGIFDDKLKLTANANQFKHLNSEQLLQLKSAFANVMQGKPPNLIDEATGKLIGHATNK